MTIECTQTTVTYQGGTNTLQFPLPFPVLDKTDLRVNVLDNKGDPAILTEGTDYEWLLTRNEKRETTSITLQLKHPLPEKWTLEIRRIVPLTQESLFTNQGPNTPKITEYSLDRTVMMAQQLDTSLNEIDARVFGVEDATVEMSNMLAVYGKMLAEFGEEKASKKEVERLEIKVHELAQAITPEKPHANTHSAAGSDPITPESIGALSGKHALEDNPHSQYALRGHVEKEFENTTQTLQKLQTEKADKTEVQDALDQKADLADVDAKLSGKADKTDVTELRDDIQELRNDKVDVTAFNDALDDKVDAEAVADQFADLASSLQSLAENALPLDHVDPALHPDPHSQYVVKANLPIASDSSLGAIKVDGVTATADADGTLRILGGGGSGGGVSDHRELSHRNEPGQHSSVALTHGSGADAVAMSDLLDAMRLSLNDKIEADALEPIAEALAGKVDGDELTRALDVKADKTETASLSASIQDLREGKVDNEAFTGALSGKADMDDVRLSDAREPLRHAASHAAGGADGLTPAAIGAMPSAPGGGKSYLAAGGGWVEFTAPDVISDHSRLENLDAPNQHPQSAITGLGASLAAKADAAATTASLAKKADASHGHVLADVSTLQSSLAAKADAATVSTRFSSVESSIQTLNTGKLATSHVNATSTPNPHAQYVLKASPPLASVSTPGMIKVDGVTATVNTDGTLKIVGGGGGGSGSGDGMYPRGSFTFYCDPAGDSSLNTPGTQAAPFKSMLSAFDALKKQYGDLRGTVTLIFNPGTYVEENVDIIGPPLGGSHLVLAAANQANRPVLRAKDYFRFRGGSYSVQGIAMRCPFGMAVEQYASFASTGCTLNATQSSGKYAIQCNNSTLLMENGAYPYQITLDSYDCEALFSLQNSQCVIAKCKFNLDPYLSFKSFVRAVNHTIAAFDAATFSGLSYSDGRRYSIENFSKITTGGGGANFFPGSSVGTIDSSSQYT